MRERQVRPSTAPAAAPARPERGGRDGGRRQPVSAGPAAVPFSDLPVHPHEPVRPAPQPRIRVRSFEAGARGAAGGPLPDKSVREESELQDQSAKVATFATKADGVQMEVDAEGVFTSAEFPDGFKWTQTIDTNVPLGGTTSPYVDPRPNDDTKPFYWTDTEHAANPTKFIDFPKRPAPATGTTTWDATLALNGVDESTKTVTMFDALTYGFSRDSTGTVTKRGPGSSSGGAHRSTLASEFPDWTFKSAGHAGLGAVIGGIAGGAIGGAAGGLSGALIGGALGAAGGALIGGLL
jgi:hypothetical protein